MLPAGNVPNTSQPASKAPPGTKASGRVHMNPAKPNPNHQIVHFFGSKKPARHHVTKKTISADSMPLMVKSTILALVRNSPKRVVVPQADKRQWLHNRASRKAAPARNEQQIRR